MNIHKHMEAIFIVTFAVVGAGSVALDSMAGTDARPAAAVACTVTPPGATAVGVRTPTAPRHA